MTGEKEKLGEANLPEAKRNEAKDSHVHAVLYNPRGRQTGNTRYGI